MNTKNCCNTYIYKYSINTQEYNLQSARCANDPDSGGELTYTATDIFTQRCLNTLK